MRWVRVVVAAVLTVGAAVAANQILHDGIWDWRWILAAVVLTVGVGILADVLAKPQSKDQAPSQVAVTGPTVAGVNLSDRASNSGPIYHAGLGGSQHITINYPPSAERRDDPVEERAGDSFSPGGHSSIGVGESDDGTHPGFADAYKIAGGWEALGQPQHVVAQTGPGSYQQFAGGEAGDTVICALPSRPPVVMPLSAWQELRAIGGRASIGEDLDATGFPVSPSPTDPFVVAPSTTSMSLDGGQWIPGRLTRRDPTAPWSWEPVSKVDLEVTHGSRWTIFEPAGLVLRAVGVFPWVRTAVDESVPPTIRRALQIAMSTTEFAKVFSVLSMHRGVEVPAPTWSAATGIDAVGDDRCVHLRATVSAPDGKPAMTGDALLHLPDFVGLSSVLSCVQLRVNLDAMRSALAESDVSESDMRLSMTEVINVLASAWNTATSAVPSVVVDDPAFVPITQPPFVELHLRTIPPAGEDRPQSLAEVIDISLLGASTRNEPPGQTGMRVFAPIGIRREERQTLIADGLARLARSWGYVNADADDLLRTDN